MISLLTGKMRSGKTLHAVEMIYEALCEGRFIVTNIEIYFGRLALLALKEKGIVIREEQIQILDLNKTPAFHQEVKWGIVGQNVLAVFDEIHLFFNSRDYAKTDKLHRSMLSFLSQSGKACVDVVFLAQVAGQVEKQFRAQAKIEVSISCLQDVHIPIFGKLPFTQNIMKTIDLDTNAVLRTQRRDYPKKMFGCYNTLAFVDDAMREASEDHERFEPLQLDKVSDRKKRVLIKQVEESNKLLYPDLFVNSPVKRGFFARILLG